MPVNLLIYIPLLRILPTRKGVKIVGFCTPILKGFITEQGVVAANYGVQVFGGHGYLKSVHGAISRDSHCDDYEWHYRHSGARSYWSKTLMDKFAQLKFSLLKCVHLRCRYYLVKTSKSLQFAWRMVKMSYKWQYLAFRMGLQAKKIGMPLVQAQSIF